MIKFNERKNGRGQRVIEINEDTVAVFKKGTFVDISGDRLISINQKDPTESDKKYDTVYLSKNEIIALAEQLKGEE
jgi:hypothetical protein